MTTISTRYKFASPDRYELLKEYAKENRREATLSERVLWECLRNKQLGVEFRRQHIIYDYIADFVSLDKQLIIEVDGGYHAERTQMEDDEIRTRNLNVLGFSVIRFKNEDVLYDIANVLKRIKKELECINK